MKHEKPELKVWTIRARAVQKEGKYVEGWNDCWHAFDKWLQEEKRTGTNNCFKYYHISRGGLYFDNPTNCLHDKGTAFLVTLNKRKCKECNAILEEDAL